MIGDEDGLSIVNKVPNKDARLSKISKTSKTSKTSRTSKAGSNCGSDNYDYATDGSKVCVCYKLLLIIITMCLLFQSPGSRSQCSLPNEEKNKDKKRLSKEVRQRI